MKPAAALVALALTACSSGRVEESDAGVVVHVDAGPLANGPLPAPLLRLDDGSDSFPRSLTFQGVVTANSVVTHPPSSLNVTPASHLDISNAGTPEPVFYYTLPIPYRLLLFPDDQVSLTFKEAIGTANAPHSYGVLIRRFGQSNALVMLAEDGASGPAFTAAEQLGFQFALDTQSPATLRENVDCGEKAHYPGTISQGGRSVHLYPGESTEFTVDGVDLKFTLFDLYRFENSSCGAAPELSIAYLVQPKS